MVALTGGYTGLAIYSSTEACIYILSDIFTAIELNYQFVCQNQIFDENDKVVIVNNGFISCEMMKINRTFFYDYNLWNHEFLNVSWTIDYKAKRMYTDRLLLGFENSLDVEEKTGFRLCSPRIIPEGILWVPSRDAYISVESNLG